MLREGGRQDPDHHGGPSPLGMELGCRDVLDGLPAAIYTTDAAGRITYFNEAAADLWGHRPKLGSSEWCGAWRLYWPDGTPLPHDQCPMAVALKENRAIRGVEAVAERPDGSRVPFIPYPTPVRDASGAVIGAVNMLVDITERKRAEVLRESEERYCYALAEEKRAYDEINAAAARLADVLESTTDSVIVVNRDWRISYLNKRAANTIGVERDACIGLPLSEPYPEMIGGPFDMNFRLAMERQARSSSKNISLPMTGGWRFTSIRRPTASRSFSAT